MNSPKKSAKTSNKAKGSNEDIGWLKIITTVFNSKNALIITSATAISSAAVYAIAYLYQCRILRSWNIPVETIDNAGGKVATYYVVFGILYAISVIVTQVVVRHISLDAAIVRKIQKALRKSTKVATESTKLLPKDRQEKWRTSLKKSHHKLEKTVKKIVAQTVVKNVIISIILLIPFYIIFQMLATDASWILLLITSAAMSVATNFSGFIQANILLPSSIRKLLRQSKNLDGDLEKAVALSRQAAKIMNEWRTNKESGGQLRRIWNTVSRVDVYSAIISVFMMAFLLVTMGDIVPKTQTHFWIFENILDEQGSYAAVYFNGDKAVLKRVIIEEDTIRVDLNSQVYMTYDNTEMKMVSFSRVVLEE